MGLVGKEWDYNFDSGIEREKVGLACFNTLLGAGTERFVPRFWNIPSIPPPLSMVKQAFIGAPYIHFRAGKNSGLTRTTAKNFFKRSMEKTDFFWIKDTLFGGWEGDSESLNQKNLHHVVFAFLGPPGIQPTFMDKFHFIQNQNTFLTNVKALYFVKNSPYNCENQEDHQINT